MVRCQFARSRRMHRRAHTCRGPSLIACDVEFDLVGAKSSDAWGNDRPVEAHSSEILWKASWFLGVWNRPSRPVCITNIPSVDKCLDSDATTPLGAVIVTSVASLRTEMYAYRFSSLAKSVGLCHYRTYIRVVLEDFQDTIVSRIRSPSYSKRGGFKCFLSKDSIEIDVSSYAESESQ